MGIRELLLVADSDDEFPPSVGTLAQHGAAADAFWTELEKKKKTADHAAARSSKHQLAVADSSSTADSRYLEDVDAVSSRRRHNTVAARGSRKPQDTVDASGSRKHLHAVTTGGSRKGKDVVDAGGSRKRRHVVSSGGSRKGKDVVDDGRSRKRRHVASAGGSRKGKDAVDASGSRRHRHAVSAGGSRKELRKLAKSYVATGRTLVTTVEMKMIQDFLASVFPVYGCAAGTCSLVVHTLTTSNVDKKKQMKLPRRAVPSDLALSGPVTLRFHPDVSVEGSYNVHTIDDGRVETSCWKKFIHLVRWKANMKIVMLFYRRDDMTCLFLHPLDAAVMA